MTDYTQNARSVINGFLWDQLKENSILLENDYRPDGFTKHLIPIVPAQEVPEFNNLLPNKSYIIYDYEVEGYSDDWWVCHELMTYTIISSEYSKVSEIIEFMIDLFRRTDISGQEIQAFNPKNDLIKFYTVNLDSASSPAPFDMEGGRMMAVVEISYKYSRIVGDSGRFS